MARLNESGITPIVVADDDADTCKEALRQAGADWHTARVDDHGMTLRGTPHCGGETRVVHLTEATNGRDGNGVLARRSGKKPDLAAELLVAAGFGDSSHGHLYFFGMIEWGHSGFSPMPLSAAV